MKAVMWLCGTTKQSFWNLVKIAPHTPCIQTNLLALDECNNPAYRPLGLKNGFRHGQRRVFHQAGLLDSGHIASEESNVDECLVILLLK